MWLDDYELADPPRGVSPALQLQILFRSGNQAFAWAWVFGWLFVIWLLALLGGLNFADELRFATSKPEEVSGRIKASAGTSVEVNERPVVAFEFTFTDGSGVKREATSYSQQSEMPAGRTVSVEYLASDPDTARIVGMRLATFPVWIVLLMGAFPCVGVLLIMRGLRRGLENRRLLRSGRLALGKLLSREATNVSINEQPVMELTFAFVDHEGRSQRLRHKTHLIDALVDDDEERLLYDPQDPTRAVLLDDLPGDGSVNPAGEFVCLGGPLVGLKMPILTLVVHGAIFLALCA
ncbi:MAG: DUF3592 domain-containing protein [Planctomycetes bacterium]|nr:DUF3592 domain-containing protein [Planctomycetota bacterium]